MRTDCPFCTIESSRVFYAGITVFGIWDQYPVSPGHALLIPRRHIASWFDATQEEQHELLQAISSVREQILQRFQADGFNIGINDGTAAGQTVRHLHVHLIPRYRGDVPDPAGGVRYVIPEKANYLRGGMGAGMVADSDAGHRLVTGEHDPLLPYLISHLSLAAKVDIAVAFTMRSGIKILRLHLEDFLGRGGELRFLTGDYLDVSDPDALAQLLDLKEASRDRGTVSLRIFEAGSLSFHPKVYIIRYQDGSGVAIVGSSNLSESALGAGVEWNYRVISSHDQAGYQEALQAFSRLFEHPATTEITVPWIAAYRTRRRQRPEPAPEVLIEPPEAPPTPNVVQQEALQQLEESRARGNRAGLVVLATGLGKTWLSAFDSNRPEFQRILFVAHREEILDQAQKTFRRIRPEAHLGFYTGGERTETADILFASVQTLSRVQHLHRFAPDHFDYIVIDEFHHADARTYRRLIDYFEPRFLLGLTATPERTDGGDLLALCQENLVYRCDIPEGISRNLLCPFHYFGVPDEVDYAQIPWRGNRFDPEVLSQHLATQARAQNALEQYLANRGKTTLAFCCSIQHTEFMKQYFTQAGIRSAAVHSGVGSDLRSVSLERLRDGDLDVLFSVDMFSEGVDLPDVDTVLMLRPTESRILWLQQLGRGLRWVEGKTLKVIDYIGNHRSFLDKTNTLLQLIYGLDPRYSLVAERLRVIASGNPELPPGCAVTYDLRSIDILRRLLPREDHADSIKAFYVDFRTRQGRRPTAVEAFHEGYNPRTLRTAYGSWLQFVAQMEGELMPAPQRALLAGRTGAFLGVLESTPMTKSYKMLTLLAMLNEDQLPGSLTIEALGDGIVRLARRSEHYLRDVSVDMADREALRTLLVDNPVAAWTQGRGTGAVAYFGYSGGQFRSLIEVPAAQREDFQELVREIVDWRLADYLERQKGAGWNENHVVCKVIQSSGRPILKLPAGCENRPSPWDWQQVEVDGEVYLACFVRYFVNVVRRYQGEEDNHLPAIVRKWFGDDAGLPGTRYQVAFERKGDHYELSPLVQPAPRNEAQLWQTYQRAEIPLLFGLEPLAGLWNQQGFIVQGDHVFLLVTLDKDGVGAEYQYQDAFLSPSEFKWQSQNRTTQASRHGECISRHREQGAHVHLFAKPRKRIHGQVAPFYYCGELDFQRWEGEKPITVWWQLQTPVPEYLRTVLKVPPTA